MQRATRRKTLPVARRAAWPLRERQSPAALRWVLAAQPRRFFAGLRLRSRNRLFVCANTIHAGVREAAIIRMQHYRGAGGDAERRCLAG